MDDSLQPPNYRGFGVFVSAAPAFSTGRNGWNYGCGYVHVHWLFIRRNYNIYFNSIHIFVVSVHNYHGTHLSFVFIGHQWYVFSKPPYFTSGVCYLLWWLKGTHLYGHWGIVEVPPPTPHPGDLHPKKVGLYHQLHKKTATKNTSRTISWQKQHEQLVSGFNLLEKIFVKLDHIPR